MKKLFLFLTAILFAGSMMAGTYTITFKDNGSGNGDSNAGLTSTTVTDYVAEGAEYISAIAASGKVYNGQDGYGLKFGNSSNPGSVTLTLAASVKPTSIVMNASPWGTNEGSGLLQDSVFNTTVTGGKGTFADFTYVYDGNTEVSTIIVGTNAKRGYVKSLTINFEDAPASTVKTIYCKAAQDWWKEGGAATGVYAYGNNDAKNAEWPGVRMTAVEGEADLWKADIDTALYHTVIFTRFNPNDCDAAGCLNWGAKTGDLLIPADKDLYTITSETAVWEAVGGAAGEWSVYGEEPEAGCDWENIEFLGGPAEYADQFKVCKTGDQPTVVNIQTAPWADGNTGIYIYFTSAEINGISLAEGQYTIEGAGILLYLSAFTAKETEVTVNWNGNDVVFTVYNVNGTEGEEEPVLADPTNCAEAREAALSVENNNELYNNGAEYTIEGYVTAIATAFNASYKNISFWMADTENGGQVIQAYRAVCDSAAAAPGVGDKVAVTGKLTKYGTTPEFAAGCTFVIKEKSAPAVNLGEKTIAEFLNLKNFKDTCILTGIVSDIVSTTYGNLYLADETDTVYVYGVLTPEGAAKQFATLGVAEGDTLTIKAIYGEYNNAPQISNAIFVSVKKGPFKATISSLETPGALIWEDAVEEEGWWQIYGGNKFCSFSLSNLNLTIAEAAGTYTAEELSEDLSFINVYGEQDTATVHFTAGSVTVAISEEGEVTVKGTLIGNDENEYLFDLTYVDPVATDTIEVTIPNATLDETYAHADYYFVYGLSKDSIGVQLGIMPDGTDGFEGDYTEYDLDYGDYFTTSMVYLVKINRIELIFSASIHVVPGNGEGVYSIIADLLCYSNTLYKVTMQIGDDTDAIDNTAVAGKAAKVISNGQVVIIRDGKKINMLGVEL